jgi:ATP-binding cassette subfamily B protein
MNPVNLKSNYRATGKNEPDRQPLEFRLIRRLFGYTRPYACGRNWLLALVMARAVQMPALAWLIGWVINGPIARQNLRMTVWWAAAFFGLALVTQVCFHFRLRLALNLGEAVIQDLRRDIFIVLLQMPMSYFNRTKIGSIISRFTSDAEAVRKGVKDVFFVSIAQGGQMLVTAVLMLWCDRVLFLTVLAIAPILALLNHYFRRILSRATRALQESWSRVTASLAESVDGIRVTQGFVRQDVNAGLFSDLMNEHLQRNIGVARASGIFMPLLELNGQIFIAVLLVLGGYRVLNPAIQMDHGNLIQFFLLANIFFGSIRPVGEMYHQAQTAMAGAERIFDLLDSAPGWEEPADAADLPRIQGLVEFKDVSFSYSERRRALDRVSFVAAPGQTIALVGPTGSGKTSIVNLIAKFYLPDVGSVRIDGRDTRDIKGGALHRQMGLVIQSNDLFTGSVMDNIRFGRPRAGDPAVIDAVRTLGFLDLIERLPRGFDTPVGEGGQTLSLGQSQLVCFARAMLADPRILILDEATNAVDAETEESIQQALIQLLRGRTSFIVAHRLSTIRRADRVIVLNHGRIVEQGTHPELLAAGGTYAGLYHRFVSG